MSALIGTWTVAGAVLAACAAVVASLAAVRLDDRRWLTRARWLIAALAALITVSCVALLVALVQDDFRLAYVAGYSERALPTAYKFAAFWAGQEGSILLWGWLVAVMSLFAVLQRRPTASVKEEATIVATLAVISGFFAALMLFTDTYQCAYCDQSAVSRSTVVEHMAQAHPERAVVEPGVASANPFKLSPTVPDDGRGLNPLLQDPAMIAHPPFTFMGYAGFTIPFAMLIGALVAGRTDQVWLMHTRKWILFSWLTLSIGIMLGAWWAYIELGWGGYWAWDPVENASLLPWLTGTALLHSIMAQQQRDMFKRWNAGLIIASFALCITATWITRSGVIQSVHAFGRSMIGTLFLGMLIATVLVSVAILAWRWKRLGSKQRLENLVSKEGAFLATNVLLVIMTATTLLGTLWPLPLPGRRSSSQTATPPRSSRCPKATRRSAGQQTASRCPRVIRPSVARRTARHCRPDTRRCPAAIRPCPGMSAAKAR